jgi:hypothetical protein
MLIVLFREAPPSFSPKNIIIITSMNHPVAEPDSFVVIFIVFIEISDLNGFLFLSLKKIIKDANFLSRKSKKKIIPEKPYLI